MRYYVLGVGIDAVSQHEALDRMEDMVHCGGYHQVVTANPEILENALHKGELKALINKASLVTADGQGILLAGKILGYPFPERVTGIELTEKLCAESGKRQLRLYFLGSSPGVVDEAKARMEAKYPDVQIVGCHHGYFRKEGPAAVIEAVKAAKPDVLLVGLGSPYQETFIQAHQAEMQVPVAMGVGGSFDVLSGRVKRAPEIFQRLRLEWAYRIATDRKRWKRSLALPRFVFHVLRQRKNQL